MQNCFLQYSRENQYKILIEGRFVKNLFEELLEADGFWERENWCSSEMQWLRGYPCCGRWSHTMPTQAALSELREHYIFLSERTYEYGRIWKGINWQKLDPNTNVWIINIILIKYSEEWKYCVSKCLIVIIPINFKLIITKI